MMYKTRHVAVLKLTILWKWYFSESVPYIYNDVHYDLAWLFYILVPAAPVVSIFLRSYPINSNYYSGLQLNLTCAINILVSTLENIQQIRVMSQWRRYNTALTQDNRRTITIPRKVGPMLYHTSIILQSLDKNRDEGVYYCTADVIVVRERQNFTKTISTNHPIFVPSKFNWIIHLNWN